MSELRRQRSVAGSAARDSDGKRDSSAPNATSPSSRASGAPMQKWIPWPKATCRGGCARVRQQARGVPAGD